MTISDDLTRKMLTASDAAAAYANTTGAFGAELSSSAAAVAALCEGSAIRRMFEDLHRHDKMMRTMLGPEEELRRAGLLSRDYLWNGKLPPAEETLAGFGGGFRLPEFIEARPLLQQFEKSLTTDALTAMFAREDEIAQAMKKMTSPWLSTQDEIGSFGAFATMQAMGFGVREFGGFDDAVAKSLRGSLGDWRDTISWPEDIFSDSLARSAFYVDRGFDARLTSFPANAFAQTMDIAGLRRLPPPVLENYRLDEEPEADEEEEGFARTNNAHDRLMRFETHMRRFIEQRLKSAYGDSWMKQRVPGSIYAKWQDNRQKAQESGRADAALPLIAYAEFGDYLQIITRNDNWNGVFKVVFHRSESVKESFQRLFPIRHCTMHARIVTQDDQMYLYVEVKRLLDAIGVES